MEHHGPVAAAGEVDGQTFSRRRPGVVLHRDRHDLKPSGKWPKVVGAMATPLSTSNVMRRRVIQAL